MFNIAQLINRVAMSDPGTAIMKKINRIYHNEPTTYKEGAELFDDFTDIAFPGVKASVKEGAELFDDFTDIAFGGAMGTTPFKTQVKEGIDKVANSKAVTKAKDIGTAVKDKASEAYTSTKTYLEQGNMSPQNFIRSYEDNIEAIAKERGIKDFDLKSFLTKGDTYEGLDAGMQALRKEVLEGIDSEKLFTKRGMEGMLENFDATGNLYSGFNKAGETTGSPLINLLSGTTDHTGKNVAGLLGTAALAGGVNSMMGGDFGEGALAGGLAAFSARGISQAYMRNMGGMEESFMKNMLGKNYLAGGKIADKTPITSIPKNQADILTMKDIGFKSDKTITDHIAGKSYKKPPTTREAINPRVRNLQAVNELDTKKTKAFIERKGPNRVMAHNRAMTIGGGMLAGVAFTGRSDKRDYRRGFNSHRGNRI